MRSVTQQQNAFAQLEQENEDARMAQEMADGGVAQSPTANQGMMAPQGLQTDDFRPDTAAAIQAVQAMEGEGADIDGFGPPDGGGAGLGDSQLVSNQPYDEAMALNSEDESSMMSSGFEGNSMHAPGAEEQAAAEPQAEEPQYGNPQEDSGFGSEFGSESPSPMNPGRSLAGDDPVGNEDALAGFATEQDQNHTMESSQGPGSPPGGDNDDEEDDDDDDESSSDDEPSGMGPGMGGGGHDDADYDSLQVGPDVSTQAIRHLLVLCRSSLTRLRVMCTQDTPALD